MRGRQFTLSLDKKKIRTGNSKTSDYGLTTVVISHHLFIFMTPIAAVPLHAVLL
jgi:hypothetical protein